MNLRVLFIILSILAVLLSALFLFFLVRANGLVEEKTQDVLTNSQIDPSSGDFKQTEAIKNLDELPPPVQRYLQIAIQDRTKSIHHVRLKQSGELQLEPAGEAYRGFKAHHLANGCRPAFLWDAGIQMIPSVRVLDSYSGGTGSGSVFLLSAIPLQGRSDEKHLNSGALFRYLAEAVWYPTALLPSRRLTWSEVSETSALATLKDGDVRVSLEFRFSEKGLVESIYAEERYGLFGEEYRKHPWEGRFYDYREVDGLLVPHKAQVGWHLPDGYWLFWKATVEEIRYEYGCPQDQEPRKGGPGITRDMQN